MKKPNGKKSGKKSGSSTQFKPGADPRRGNGPAKGAPNAGRPPDAFKELCRELATGEKTIAAVKAILKDETHAQFMAALKWASEHGYGKPAQPLEHSGSITFEDFVAKSREG